MMNIFKLISFFYCLKQEREQGEQESRSDRPSFKAVFSANCILVESEQCVAIL